MMAHADAVAPSSSRAVRARPCALGGATRPPTDLCPLCDWTKAVPHATRHPAAVNVALWERDSVWLKTVAKAELDLVRQLLILLNEWQARVREVATMLPPDETALVQLIRQGLVCVRRPTRALRCARGRGALARLTPATDAPLRAVGDSLQMHEIAMPEVEVLKRILKETRRAKWSERAG